MNYYETRNNYQQRNFRGRYTAGFRGGRGQGRVQGRGQGRGGYKPRNDNPNYDGENRGFKPGFRGRGQYNPGYRGRVYHSKFDMVNQQ